MADHEESYFLKYLFLIFVGFFASRHFSFNPVPTRLTDKRLMDKHSADKQATDKQATDKHRPGSAYVTACCPANTHPRRSPMTKRNDNPRPRRYDKNINTPPTVTVG